MRDKPDIVSAFEREGVELRRKGQYFWCLCPLHSEKTPSCKIDPIRQTFHCFGCSKGGDAISFIRELKGLTYQEAISILNIPNNPLDPRTTQKRRLIQNFREWERRYHADLCTLYRTIQNHKARVRSIADIDTEAYHQEPIIGYWLDVLENGNDEAKYNLYVEVTGER